MRYLYSRVAGFVVVAAIGTSVAASAARAVPSVVTICTTTPPLGTNQLAYAIKLGTGSDAQSVEWRTQFKVSKLIASQIAVVTNESVCAQAVKAFNTWYGGSPAATRAYVIKFGNYYWVDNPDLQTKNDARPWVLFKSTWVQVMAFGT